MQILIAGITGPFGQLLAKEALKRGHSVRGLGRDEAKFNAAFNHNPKVSFVSIKKYYDEETLDIACRGCDAVISAYGMDPQLSLEGQLFLLRAADRAGIKRFVANCWNGDYRAMQFGAMESYTPYMAFREQSQLESAIRPIYVFVGVFAEYILAGQEVEVSDYPWRPQKTEVELWGTGDELMMTTPCADAAAYTFDILERDDAEQGGDWLVYTWRMSYNQYAEEYKKATGKEKKIIIKGSLDDLRNKEQQARVGASKLRYWDYLGITYLLRMLDGTFEGNTDKNQNHLMSASSRTNLSDFFKSVDKATA